jgi:hypothetical protein
LFEGFKWFWGLTCDFWAENSKKYIKPADGCDVAMETTADPFGVTTKQQATAETGGVN